MSYTATLTANGQITVPKAIRLLLGVEPGGKIVFDDSADAITVTRAKTREEEIDEMVRMLDSLREKAIRKNPRIAEKIRENAGKAASEMREEFDNSPEGEAYCYKYTPAYYYEQHPEEPRTPEIQAAINRHNKLLDDLAAADPARAERLEEYRAN